MVTAVRIYGEIQAGERTDIHKYVGYEDEEQIETYVEVMHLLTGVGGEINMMYVYDLYYQYALVCLEFVNCSVAQRKRVGLITQRSMNGNHLEQHTEF